MSMTETPAKRKPRGRQCLCTVCGEMFGGEVTFDAHRVGDFATPTKPNNRRCMTSAEMKDAGLTLKNDVWVTKARF